MTVYEWSAAGAAAVPVTPHKSSEPQSVYNTRGVRFTAGSELDDETNSKSSAKTSSGKDDSKTAIAVDTLHVSAKEAYGVPCILELFRFLVSLINPRDHHNSDTMMSMGLALLTVCRTTLHIVQARACAHARSHVRAHMLTHAHSLTVHCCASHRSRLRREGRRSRDSTPSSRTWRTACARTSLLSYGMKTFRLLRRRCVWCFSRLR